MADRHGFYPRIDANKTETKMKFLDQAKIYIRSGDGGNGCVAFRRDGQPCAGRPRTGVALCPYHDPGNAAALREAARKGGKASAAQRRVQSARPPGPIEFDHIYTCDRDGIQRMLDALFRLELSGMLPAARTRNLIRLLETSFRNITAGSSGVSAPDIGDFRRSFDEEVLRAVGAGPPREGEGPKAPSA